MLEAAAAGIGPPWDILVQYGALGVMVLALGLFAWSAIQRERKRADDAEARYEALQGKLIDVIVPVITRATDAVDQQIALAKRGS